MANVSINAQAACYQSNNINNKQCTHSDTDTWIYITTTKPARY